MAKAQATVEDLEGMIERGELELPEMQRGYVKNCGTQTLDRQMIPTSHGLLDIANLFTRYSALTADLFTDEGPKKTRKKSRR